MQRQYVPQNLLLVDLIAEEVEAERTLLDGKGKVRIGGSDCKLDESSRRREKHKQCRELPKKESVYTFDDHELINNRPESR